MFNTILAIDTASAECSVALLQADDIVSRVCAEPRQAAQQVLPMISALLEESGLAMQDIDGIAVLAGPGSFTGIRIGVGVAQGLAMSTARPVLALSTLAVLAHTGLRTTELDRALVSNLARDGEVYFGAYEASASAGVELIGQELVCQPTKILDSIPQLKQQLMLSQASAQSWCAVGDAWVNKDELLTALNIDSVYSILPNEIVMRDLGELARLRFKLGQGNSDELVLPNYIKEQLDYS